jgi:hypothetical protein
MKVIYALSLFLHGFVGIGAVAGGLAAITNPQSPLGVPLDLLKDSPFSSYLIPGIILFSIIGLGNIVSAISTYFKWKYMEYISCIFSAALVIWIVVQCIMLSAVAFLHVLFFIIGLIQSGLAITVLFKHNLFPTNIVIKLYKQISKGV